MCVTLYHRMKGKLHTYLLEEAAVSVCFRTFIDDVTKMMMFSILFYLTYNRIQLCFSLQSHHWSGQSWVWYDTNGVTLNPGLATPVTRVNEETKLYFVMRR